MHLGNLSEGSGYNVTAFAAAPTRVFISGNTVHDGDVLLFVPWASHNGSCSGVSQLLSKQDVSTGNVHGGHVTTLDDADAGFVSIFLDG
eukprot:7108679-Prymnesium_polylepis.1